VPADVTLEPGDSIRWINRDAVAKRIDCIDNAVPEPPFCWLDTVGTLNNVGSDFSVGAGAGINLIGTWSYRDAANPTRTGKFSVAVNPATIATIALDIGPACALPATTAVFLGDKINVRNTAEVAYTFRISNSVGTLIRQFNINNGQTVVVDTLTTVGLAGSQAYTVRCEGTTATPGALTIGLSRNNNNSPATPAPPGQTPAPPGQTPQPAGAPSTPVPPGGAVPQTPAPNVAGVTPVPGVVAGATPAPAVVVTPSPAAVPGGPGASPASGSCLDFCKKTCTTVIATCDCSTNPPSVTCMAPAETVKSQAARPLVAATGTVWLLLMLAQAM
jgi:hypothetical protein